VFVTGGNAAFPFFDARLHAEITACRPTGSPVRVVKAHDCVLDAWKGAAKFCNSALFSGSIITKQQYDEMGHSYLAEHFCSNTYLKL
jgi:actin-related protein 5